MKAYLPSLHTGDLVEGRIMERLACGDLIISFHGDLLRVHNETGANFLPGQNVTLEVASLQPLRFRFPRSSRRRPRLGHIDVLG